MFKIFEKFLKNLKKLDSYYVLRQEENLIILGTKVIVKEHQELMGNIFQPQTRNVNKELPVFFLVSVEGDKSSLNQDFRVFKLPILILNKNQLILENDNLKDLLEKFLVDTFKS